MSDDQRLVGGPAWGSPLGSPVAADQWPTFRGNSNRGNYCEAKLGAKLGLAASTRLLPEQLPGPIPQDWGDSIMPRVSAPVIADNLVLISLVHDAVCWRSP